VAVNISSILKATTVLAVVLIVPRLPLGAILAAAVGALFVMLLIGRLQQRARAEQSAHAPRTGFQQWQAQEIRRRIDKYLGWEYLPKGNKAPGQWHHQGHNDEYAGCLRFSPPGDVKSQFKKLPGGFPVRGMHIGGRKAALATVGRSADFALWFEREPDNPISPTAIKVVGSGTIAGAKQVHHLGYIAKENEGELFNIAERFVAPFEVLVGKNGHLDFQVAVYVDRKTKRSKAAKGANTAGEHD
jgi:hypothetical protein